MCAMACVSVSGLSRAGQNIGAATVAPRPPPAPSLWLVALCLWEHLLCPVITSCCLLRARKRRFPVCFLAHCPYTC